MRPILCFALLVTLIAHALATPVNGQFMRIRFSLDSEAGVDLSSNLELGILRPNSGLIEVGIGDPLAGRIDITTDENITLLVTYQGPEHLQLDQDNRIPMRIEAAYNNSRDRRPLASSLFEENRAVFPVSDSGMLEERMNLQETPLTVTLYFFGSAEVGDVASGIYTGQISVTVEYE